MSLHSYAILWRRAANGFKHATVPRVAPAAAIAIEPIPNMAMAAATRSTEAMEAVVVAAGTDVSDNPAFAAQNAISDDP